MFDNIVVGTDGSDTAAMAVTVAADLAKTHNAVLHLVNAYKVPTSGVAVVGAGSMAVADPLLSSASLKDASEKVLAEAAKLAGGAKVEAHAVVGSPADVVVTVAHEVGADLIVVGSKGMKGARRMIGSVPNSVAHNAPCHVLVAKTA
ncbi:MAG TPA: universal stress protein [Acidimicrobiales bacterium]|nr:universal stress protein [Acidimicrobiales bacterium]